MMKFRFRMKGAGAAVIAAIAVSGCTVGPKYHQPDLSVPTGFRGSPTNVAASSGNSFGEQKWWDVFQDPQLQSLIRAAIEDNYDVRIAATRVLEAQAQVGIAQSDQLPSAAGLAT